MPWLLGGNMFRGLRRGRAVVGRIAGFNIAGDTVQRVEGRQRHIGRELYTTQLFNFFLYLRLRYVP